MTAIQGYFVLQLAKTRTFSYLIGTELHTYLSMMLKCKPKQQLIITDLQNKAGETKQFKCRVHLVDVKTHCNVTNELNLKLVCVCTGLL